MRMNSTAGDGNSVFVVLVLFVLSCNSKSSGLSGNMTSLCIMKYLK